MNSFNTTLQDNFYQINGALALLFLIIYGLLLVHLIGHMREMVRLKYHVDKRAEFDESRVKIIIGVILLLGLVYLGVWIYSLIALDITKISNYQLASALFKAVSVSLLVGAYVIYFINNRIKGDINHIKRTINSRPDESQQAFHHL